TSAGDAGDDVRGGLVVAGKSVIVVDFVAESFDLFPKDSCGARRSHDLAGIYRSHVIGDQLPDLGAGDFSGGSILYEAADCHGTVARQPDGRILHGNIEVIAYTFFGDFTRCGFDVE